VTKASCFCLQVCSRHAVFYVLYTATMDKILIHISNVSSHVTSLSMNCMIQELTSIFLINAMSLPYTMYIQQRCKELYKNYGL